MIDGRPPAPSKSGVNYERLGKAVEDALILDYIYVLHSTKRQIWSSFMRGIFTGMGGVIGATVGIALLVGVLQLFGGLPGVGSFFTRVGNTIENGPAVTTTPAPAVASPKATSAPATPAPTAAPTTSPTPTVSPAPAATP
jgi:hypothetical protein